MFITQASNVLPNTDLNITISCLAADSRIIFNSAEFQIAKSIIKIHDKRLPCCIPMYWFTEIHSIVQWFNGTCVWFHLRQPMLAIFHSCFQFANGPSVFRNIFFIFPANIIWNNNLSTKKSIRNLEPLRTEKSFFSHTLPSRQKIYCKSVT